MQDSAAPEDLLQDVLLWGAALVVLVLAVLILQHFLRRFVIDRRVRDQAVPFGIAGDDIKRMESAGRLTPEEARAVRAAMARQFLRQGALAPPPATPPGNPSDAASVLLAEEARLKGLSLPGQAATPGGKRPGSPGATTPQESIVPVAPPPGPPQDPLSLRPREEIEELYQAGFITLAQRDTALGAGKDQT